jgi:DHA1 family multidrug resistance protein-like MFS transporter
MRGIRPVPVATFLSSFAWSFVFVSLPFYIASLSTGDPTSTLRWTGWIVGIAPLVSVATVPVWGRFAERGRPRLCYVLVETMQGLGFFAVAIARTLLELFLARFVLGFSGASSTFAFMLAARRGDPAEVRREVALIQAALTVGGVIGPLAGAVTAERLGFQASFVVGGIILLGSAALVSRVVDVPAGSQDPQAGQRRVRPGDVVIAAAIVLAGSAQLFFLTPVLPQVLSELGVEPPDTLGAAGVVIFVSSAAAAIGAFAAPRAAELTSERRLLTTALLGSSSLMATLGVFHSLWAYTTVRFLQVLFIAPVFPIVVSRIAQHAGGDVIGIVNSARIAAAFVGPVLATSVLAWSSAAVVYVAIAVLGFACVPLVALPSPADRGKGPRGRRRVASRP